jgi:ribose/xylose/arabinose/galactoside ABC-type transport system permease subunit
VKNNVFLNLLFTKYISAVVFFALLVFNLLFTRNFASWTTFANIITQTSSVMLLALGMTVVIATGGIDISVGSAMGLAATISAIFLAMGHPGGTLVSLLVICLLGLLTGVLVARFSILPMVVTLAMQYIMRGLAKGVSGRGTVAYNLPGLTNFFINPLIGPVPAHFFVLLTAVMVMYILVNRMKFGSYVEFYGNNPLATRICGINTTRIVLFCYMISAIFAWLGGMIDMFMVSSADPSKIGLDLETDAIAATLIGGTPITGGYPNIIGSVFGAFLLQLITMMCNMHNIPYSYSMMLKAGIIIFALFFHGLRNKNLR